MHYASRHSCRGWGSDGDGGGWGGHACIHSLCTVTLALILTLTLTPSPSPLTPQTSPLALTTQHPHTLTSHLSPITLTLTFHLSPSPPTSHLSPLTLILTLTPHPHPSPLTSHPSPSPCRMIRGSTLGQQSFFMGPGLRGQGPGARWQGQRGRDQGLRYQQGFPMDSAAGRVAGRGLKGQPRQVEPSQVKGFIMDHVDRAMGDGPGARGRVAASRGDAIDGPAPYDEPLTGDQAPLRT